MKTKNKNIYITAILPAHNEEAGIGQALASIRSHVDKIIVACDNCDDNTPALAKRGHADVVFQTINNHHRKAGALNQALENHVDWSIPNQYILVMDADTQVLNPDAWFAKATSLVYPNRKRLDKKMEDMSPFREFLFKWLHRRKYLKATYDRAYDCVGSIFQSPPGQHIYNFIEEGQHLEWLGYRNKIARTTKVSVLTGTCSLISARMMLRVHHLYHKKQFYDDASITEDFHMTVDLKESHARLISPNCCLCATATKPDVKSLIMQRRRWDLGAMQLLQTHKLDEVTIPYLFQQINLAIGIFAFMLFVVLSISTYMTGHIKFKAVWLFIFIGFDIDQVAMIWNHGNFFDRLYSSSMLGWLAYVFVLDVSFIYAFYTLITHKKVYWNAEEKPKK